MIRIFLITAIVFSFSTSQGFAQTDSLRCRIEQIIAKENTVVGVSVLAIEGGDTLSINGSRHFPLQNVFKFPIALAVILPNHSILPKGSFIKLKLLLQDCGKRFCLNAYFPFVFA